MNGVDLWQEVEIAPVALVDQRDSYFTEVRLSDTSRLGVILTKELLLCGKRGDVNALDQSYT